MTFGDDDAGAQEIIGFMLALAALMLLFGAAVGFGVTVRDDRVDEAADAAADSVAQRLSEALLEAGTWAATYPDASLNLSIPLPRMPGATGFIAESHGTTLFVNVSNGGQAVRDLGWAHPGLVQGSISGTPDEARVRWDPSTHTIFLETT